MTTQHLINWPRAALPRDPYDGYISSVHSEEVVKPSYPDHQYKSLYNQLKRLEESRRTVLQLSEDPKENEQKKPRKISFKCKKPNTYRKLSPNTVAELTTKFNEMHEKSEPTNLAKLVRRVNSQREEGKRVVRKPSVKLKPKLDDKSPKKKVGIKAVPKNEDKIRSKGSNMENGQKTLSVKATIEIFERRSSQSSPDIEKPFVPKPKVPEKSPNIRAKDLVVKNGVRKLKVKTPEEESLKLEDLHNGVDFCDKRTNEQNVVQRKRESQRDNSKTFLYRHNLSNAIRTLGARSLSGETLKRNSEAQVTGITETVNLVLKAENLKEKEKPSGTLKNPSEETPRSSQGTDQQPSLDSTPLQISNIPSKDSSTSLLLTESSTEDSTKTDLDEVQILNIPLVMPRRCDSMYETLNLRKVSPPPNLRVSHSEEAVSKLPSEPVPNSSFLWRQKSESLDRRNPPVPPRPTTLNLKLPPKKKMPLPEEEEEEYEELRSENSYEYCHSPSKYEDLEEKVDDGGYEPFDSPSRDSTYESLPESVSGTFSSAPNLHQDEEEIYETLPNSNAETPPPLPRRKDSDHGIIPPPLPKKQEEFFLRKHEEALPKKQEEPLPPRPSSRDSYCTIQNDSNCYESIYVDKTDAENSSNNYESIYQKSEWELGSNRGSVVSSDQQSNSLYSRSLLGWANEDANLYNGKAISDLSGSDKSEDWVDISDDENSKGQPGFVVVRERQRSRKTSGWSQKIRDQWNKSHSTDQGDSGSDHHYESLYSSNYHRDNEDFDSFESDSDSDNSFTKLNQHDSGVDMSNCQLPEPPTQSYGFTRLAVSAGKHMKKLRRNWSLTKNDITKSLSRMAKRKSRGEINTEETKAKEKSPQPPRPISSPILQYQSNILSSVTNELKMRQDSQQPGSYQAFQVSNRENEPEEKSRSNSLSKGNFLNKFRRSLSNIHAETEMSSTLSKPKSTFYLTDAIDVDDKENSSKSSEDDISMVSRYSKGVANQRPHSPPPPVPTDANQNIDSKSTRGSGKRSTSWYAECGLFRATEPPLQHSNRKPNTSWYAEIGLYQSSASTPSTSSAENSGSTLNLNSKTPEPDSLTEVRETENYYNMKNENDYYNESMDSFKSDGFSNVGADIQLRLQDEPLYQFYDAAVLESVCQDGTTDFDYDGYEEVGEKNSDSEHRLSRPSAMQLITPGKNGVTLNRTLWCEIPEVLQSAVLSTLSLHQKKLQEAKFEMMTSEASYLNSLNVLTDHFMLSLSSGDLLTYEEKNILFARIPAVKKCSEKLLSDLERCWQENILLNGICDIIQKHGEENFSVYVSYCENQILLDSALKKIKERSSSNDVLKQLESCPVCHSLSLYSFLMLPMQRITRWPLLVDAVLKRLSPQDDEYLSCQYTLATINKIVTQCNEAARKMERDTELKRIAAQIEFPKNIPFIKLASGSRWLVRSGLLTQMQSRADDIKLTFGRRFSKVPLQLFLFNDLLLITKPRSDDCCVVLHYCYRSYIELNVNEAIMSLPAKDTQGRYLIFLTILENHEGKTVEMLLSCSSESDQERWIEALSPPKSEDPNETLYECWDCPQVTAIHSYTANQPDELALSRGDIVNVTRKMADGWYHGERIRDGQLGWFPANYTVEVANPHVRARNLKQRYRLLAFSENYLKSK